MAKVKYYAKESGEEDNSNNHGGYRPNSGRPATDRKLQLSVRISQEAMDKLNAETRNKSEYIDKLIKG